MGHTDNHTLFLNHWCVRERLLKKKNPQEIKTAPIRKLGNSKLQWTKTLYMYQNILSHIAFFYTLFKGYKCNKLYEITPKKRFSESPRKQFSNFTGIKKTQVKSSCIRFFRLHSLCLLQGGGEGFFHRWRWGC